MKIPFIIISIILSTGISCKINEEIPNSKNKIKIEWVRNLNGDFSFKEKWNYRESIYRNQNGELRLDSGLFPPEFGKIISRMKDETGKIYKDSLERYYKIIDTTHIFHSIKSEANVYESTVYNHMEFKKMKNGNIIGKTINNASGYSHLHIKLENEYCYAWNEYNSIKSLVGNHIFNLKSGEILIDKPLFQQGIIKAEFDFIFKNTLKLKEKLSWKGKIYSKIKSTD